MSLSLWSRTQRMSSVEGFKYRITITWVEVHLIISRVVLETLVRMERFNLVKISSIFLLNLPATWSIFGSFFLLPRNKHS
jgi:hypothetical protein